MLKTLEDIILMVRERKTKPQSESYTNRLLANKELSVEKVKEEVKELEPNIADVYYAGQLFTGSRHTTNPLAISIKIFEKFLFFIFLIIEFLALLLLAIFKADATDNHKYELL